VLWRPITTHFSSAKASFANLTIAGTFADIHICLKKRCEKEYTECTVIKLLRIWGRVKEYMRST
jgi:hypothetical protein